VKSETSRIIADEAKKIDEFNQKRLLAEAEKNKAEEELKKIREEIEKAKKKD
jgi:hypothetical protein